MPHLLRNNGEPCNHRHRCHLRAPKHREMALHLQKTTCPATMRPLDNFDLIPNHTLKNLILSWRTGRIPLQPSPSHSSSSSSSQHLELTSILSVMESSPLKVSSLKKLRSFTCENPLIFLSSGGVEAVCRILIQSNADSADDFSAFRACEEAVGVLNNLPFDKVDASNIGLLTMTESINPMLAVLQRGSAEARLAAIAILQNISKVNPSITDQFNKDMDVFKSLLDLLSDEASTRLSSTSLDLLLEAVANSKANRLKAIEAGAVSVLIELLPEANRQRREKTLLLLKRLCECAEGRSAFADHGLGIPAVASRIGRECDVGTKLGVKVLWLVCSFLPTKKVVEGMMVCGAVRKLLALIHVDCQSSAKERALRMVRMHAHAWRQYPCFPSELRAVRY